MSIYNLTLPFVDSIEYTISNSSSTMINLVGWYAVPDGTSDIYGTAPIENSGLGGLVVSGTPPPNNITLHHNGVVTTSSPSSLSIIVDDPSSILAPGFGFWVVYNNGGAGINSQTMYYLHTAGTTTTTTSTTTTTTAPTTTTTSTTTTTTAPTTTTTAPTSTTTTTSTTSTSTTPFPTTTTTPAPTTTLAPTTTTPGPTTTPLPIVNNTNIPIPIGGIDDGGSLTLKGLSVDAFSKGWFPEIAPGRYSVALDDFRYLYARPLSVALPTNSGGDQTISAELPSSVFSFKSLYESPLTVIDGSGNTLTQVCQSVRFGQPVPLSNTIEAENLITSAYLLDNGDPNQISGILTTDMLWWYPTFGGKVLEVRRSRNSRSFDVLADKDAVLYPVDTPDQIVDDRSYFVDERAGIVYGKVPASPLPPPPYSTGENAMTYVTIAYPPEAYSTIHYYNSENPQSVFWNTWFESNASFFSAYEGLVCGTGSTIYQFDPLRLEEIGYVDRDGLIRLRRSGLPELTDYSGTQKPSVVFLSPSGPILCTTTQIIGNTIDAQIPDPSRSNALSTLPYGTTVIVRYYLNNSFCPYNINGNPGINNGQVNLFIRLLCETLESEQEGYLVYESDPGGSFLPHINGTVPDINPINNETQSGFYWLEDQNDLVQSTPSIAGKLQSSVTRPSWVPGTSTGEEFTVIGQALDITNTPIPCIPITLYCANSGVSIVLAPEQSGNDGTAIFRVRLIGEASITGFNLELIDGRNGGVLYIMNLLPVII